MLMTLISLQHAIQCILGLSMKYIDVDESVTELLPYAQRNGKAQNRGSAVLTR